MYANVSLESYFISIRLSVHKFHEILVLNIMMHWATLEYGVHGPMNPYK